MQELHVAMGDAVNVDIFSVIKIEDEDFLSHLFYADDAIIIGY